MVFLNRVRKNLASCCQSRCSFASDSHFMKVKKILDPWQFPVVLGQSLYFLNTIYFIGIFVSSIMQHLFFSPRRWRFETEDTICVSNILTKNLSPRRRPQIRPRILGFLFAIQSWWRIRWNQVETLRQDLPSLGLTLTAHRQCLSRGRQPEVYLLGPVHRMDSHSAGRKRWWAASKNSVVNPKNVFRRHLASSLGFNISFNIRLAKKQL